MTIEVKCGEIDRDNNPVGETRALGVFEDRSAAERFIADKISRFDHNGFVPDGHQAGWWGRNDRNRFEKFHFWIDDTAQDQVDELRSGEFRKSAMT